MEKFFARSSERQKDRGQQSKSPETSQQKLARLRREGGCSTSDSPSSSNTHSMAAPEQLSEQHQLEALMNDPEQLGHLFEELQLSSQLTDQMSKREWLRQQQALYEEMRQPSQIETLMNNPEKLRQQQEQQDKWAERAITRRQMDNAGRLLEINLSRVSEKDWASFSAKLLNKHDKDREEGNHSYIILLDILKGSGANHISEGERKSKEYNDMKKLVIKECKKRWSWHVLKRQ